MFMSYFSPPDMAWQAKSKVITEQIWFSHLYFNVFSLLFLLQVFKYNKRVQCVLWKNIVAGATCLFMEMTNHVSTECLT